LGERGVKQMPSEKDLQSPFLNSFLSLLITNKEQFVEEIKLKGTPIIEDCPSDRNYKLVTFIWVGEKDTKNVYVLGSFPGWELSNNELTNIEGTEIWYKSFRTNKKFVSTYRFSINDYFENDWIKRGKHYQNDPFNNNTFKFVKDPEDQDSKDSLTSVIELGTNIENEVLKLQENVPKGKLETHRFKSIALKNERRIWIYTPNNYSQSNTPYKLVISFDGRPTMTTLSAPTILNNLVFNKKIPPVIMIGIDSVNRFQELTFNDDFNHFLTKELIPWIRSSYNVSVKPSDTILCGFSLGGLASFFAAFNHPEMFGNLLSLSGSVHWKKNGYEGKTPWLLNNIENYKKLPLRVFMRAGLLENEPLLEGNKNLYKILKSKGYDVVFSEFLGGHDDIWWQNELPQGLVTLLNNHEN
jgi:enterochelin esterase-like enzyme